MAAYKTIKRKWMVLTRTTNSTTGSTPGESSNPYEKPPITHQSTIHDLAIDATFEYKGNKYSTYAVVISDAIELQSSIDADGSFTTDRVDINEAVRALNEDSKNPYDSSYDTSIEAAIESKIDQINFQSEYDSWMRKLEALSNKNFKMEKEND